MQIIKFSDKVILLPLRNIWNVQSNSVVTNSVVNEHSVVTNSVVNEHSVITNSVVNEHSVIANRILGLIGYISTQINSLITNKNGRSRAVRYNRVLLYLNFAQTTRTVFVSKVPPLN